MKRPIVIGRVKEKYKKWAMSVWSRLGPQIRLDNGAKFTMRRDVTALVLADEPSFDSLYRVSEWSGTGKLMDIDDYGSISGLDDEGLVDRYRSRPASRLEIGPAFWSYAYEPIALPNGVLIPQYGSFVAVNVDAVKRVAANLSSSLPEIPRASVEQVVFNVMCLHEAGHHYMFGNFTPDEMLSIRDIIDLNLAEGYATAFALGISTPQERFALAELCTHQSAPYRFYHGLRPYVLTELFRSFIEKRDYLLGLREFIAIINVRILFSSGGIYSETFINGAPLMDLSEQGGVVMAGQRIERIVPLPSGYVISPVIEHLLGRCPRTTRIFANTIKNHVDYEILPPNVVIIPKDVVDLEQIIRANNRLDPKKRLEVVLKAISSAGFPIC